MLRFENANKAEFENWKKESIESYAREKVKCGDWSEENSIELATGIVEKFLPDGLDTKNNYLQKIVETRLGEEIGFVWYGEINSSDMGLFDFLIYEKYRGKGLSKKVLSQLEREIEARGFKKICLHVFSHNEIAISLYQKMGFNVTGYNMTKNITNGGGDASENL